MAEGIATSQSFIEGRGQNFCRGCESTELFSALNLGSLPIANELYDSVGHEVEKFPLHLRICTTCGLGQVADVVTPERIFRDYRYLSSVSSTFLEHATLFVDKLIEKETFGPNDWALEIASNDGYLLRNFLRHNVKAIGVEPAENVAEIARKLGIETISEFFGQNLANDLLAIHGYPKIIIANNVMAHVPDLVDFIKGLAILCGPETLISIENPTLANILVAMQFDTIYHEHYSYLSATSVLNICNNYGLQLFKVEELAVHGGSNRYWLRQLKAPELVENSVQNITQFEQSSGLFNEENWSAYSQKVERILVDFGDWLLASDKEGKRVFGYGAAAKASTFLNSVKIRNDLIIAISDASSEKQGRFMPPLRNGIISPTQLMVSQPTDIVIFPWNIEIEIATYLRANLDSNVRLWCAIPEMHQIMPPCQ